MLLVFIILMIVTACVTVVGTYFLLNAENYHWQWTSFTMSASTSAYVFLYSVRRDACCCRRWCSLPLLLVLAAAAAAAAAPVPALA